MGELSRPSALVVYERGLGEGGAMGDGAACHALGEDGSRRRLPLERWLGEPDAVESRLLRRAAGPVLDVGCGAGRHVAALRRRGVEAVGIEISRHAAALARRRGATVLEGSIFELPLPSRWATALLLDGNIGIGGEPTALLRRLATLLRPGGGVLVELEPPRSAARGGRVRLQLARELSEWIPWRFVGADEIAVFAAAAGLGLAELWSDRERWFAELIRERR